MGVPRRQQRPAACTALGRDPDDLVYSVALSVACGRSDREVEQRAGSGGTERFQLAGSPEQVVHRLGGYAAAGCTRVYLQLPSIVDLDHVELIAATVLPQVR